MQIKHYIITAPEHLPTVQAWAADPDHGCYVIAQGRMDSVTHSLCVYQPVASPDRITPTETHLAGMIVETAWPE